MIPLGAPAVGDTGIDHVMELLEDGLLSTGEVVEEFEARFSSFVGRNHGVAVASGSVALELALEATFEEGNRVALSPYNCGSMLYSVLRADLHPVFVDADPETAALDPNSLAERAPFDGVVSSHLFGHPARINEIKQVCERYGATLVDDFAQAPGATAHGEPVGSIGSVGVCSFGATKNLTTAEGGMVVTDDAAVAQYVSDQRTNTHDETPPPRSVRMNDIEAAIGLSQLERYDETTDRKRAVATIYRERLSDLPVDLLPVQPWATDVYHAFPVLTPDADRLAAYLDEQEIGTSRLYETPLHEYDAAPPADAEYPIAERFAEEVVLLPIHGQVTDSQARTVADAITDFYANQ
ncbi:MAG: DegT/DnrJ/EryC1/StrS family aminotransferase [Euryarchaeota archaeon]|nr:DegT/DnrJ/EryC1/StrS family aminotransferase [Euryarchaeota archaeon]